MFRDKRVIRLPEDTTPKLVVVVDTEEEFDWSKAPDSNQVSVSAMAYIDRVQTIFDEFGIRPCYVVDYPVASQADGYQTLKQYFDTGKCEIGAQLHPWVNPPLRETINQRNMYPGNLSPDLEREKLVRLCNMIEQNIGVYPEIYKAGRYGFGPNTGRILEELGFKIDLSVCPPLNEHLEGGPDYRDFNAVPFWFGCSNQRCLEIPNTGAYVGWANHKAKSIYEIALKLKRMRVPGILSRIGALDRLILSPEGFTSKEHVKLTMDLYKKGIRTFTWSFHSPSVAPGHTCYVQSDRQLKRFIDSFRYYFDFFLTKLQGESVTPTELREQLVRL